MAMTGPVALVPSELVSFIDLFPGNQVFIALKEGSPPVTISIDIRQAYKQLQNLNKAGFDIYFTVNESKSSSRTEKDIVRCRAVFLDDDTVQPRHRKDFILQPNVIVQTSEGKYHYYWTTDTDETSVWLDVMQGMIKVHETDPAPCDLPRIMRLPGFVNHKTGFTAYVVQMKDNAYSWDKIKSVYPPYVAPSSSKPDTEVTETSAKLDIPDTILKFVSGEAIAPSMNSMIMHYAANGKSKRYIKQQINNMFDKVPSDVYKEHNDRYHKAHIQIDKFINTAIRKSSNQNELPQIDVMPLRYDARAADVPEIPESAVPTILMNAALSVAKTNATHKDPAILSGVIMASALLGKNVDIQLPAGHRTNCQMGVMVAAESGARKSSMYEQMNKPFFDYEKRLRKEWQDHSQTRNSMISALKKQADRMEKDLAKSSDLGGKELEKKVMNIANIRTQIEEMTIPQPSLHSSDVTQEKLILNLQRNGGALSIVSDDGRQVINNLLGDYRDGSTAESLYITGLTNGPYKYERKGDDVEVTLDRICLNALIFVQPDKAEALIEHEMYMQSGLAARMPIYFYQFDPSEMVSKSVFDPIQVKDLELFHAALTNLQSQRYRDHAPAKVNLSENAKHAWMKFNERLAKRLKEDWRDKYGLVNKIATQAIICGTIFAAIDDPKLGHCIRDVTSEAPYVLSAKFLIMGQKFMESLFEHCIDAHEHIDRDVVYKTAERLLHSIKVKYHEERTKAATSVTGRTTARVLYGFDPYKRDFREKVARARVLRDQKLLTECVNLLVEHGWLIRTVTDKSDARAKAGEHNMGYLYIYNYDGEMRMKEGKK